MTLTSEEAKRRVACRKNHKGGRPKREKEETIIKALDKQMSIAEVIKKLAERVSLLDMDAIKTWLAYRWGRPIETQELKLDGSLEIGLKTRAKEYQELFDKFIREEECDLGDDGNAEPMDSAHTDAQTDSLSDCR